MKSVSGYCVRQRRLLSNPVTYPKHKCLLANMQNRVEIILSLWTLFVCSESLKKEITVYHESFEAEKFRSFLVLRETFCY